MPSLDELLEHMRKNGWKITLQRKTISKHILSEQGQFKAVELVEKVRDQRPDISADTVYRMLAFLCETGMLYKIDRGGKASEYEVIAGRHLHYMICTKCGEKEAFDGCALDSKLLANAQNSGFQLTGHKFELYGLCPKCLK